MTSDQDYTYLIGTSNTQTTEGQYRLAWYKNNMAQEHGSLSDLSKIAS